jgi:type IV pilus assembly protein PilN
MANINLLPWREKRRELKQREFATASIAVVLVCVLALLGVYTYFQGAISDQDERNARLDNEIRLLQVQVAEIASLRDQKQQMIDRMQVIQRLQGDRPKIVYLFDQLARTLPQGVFYKSVKREGERVQIVGIAESSARISALIRRLDASEWFNDPRPTEIKAAPQFGEFASQFTLVVAIENPNAVEEEED